MHEEYVLFLADDEDEDKWITELGEKSCVIEEKVDAYFESCYKNENESKAEIEAQLLRKRIKSRNRKLRNETTQC